MKNPVAFLALWLMTLACAGPLPEAPSAGSQAPAATGPTRVVMGIGAEPVAFSSALTPSPLSGSAGALQAFLYPGVTAVDNRGLQPQLVEAVPSLENGLWKVLPDGRMETTFTIRQGAAWHDGTPLTADDLLFTYAVVRDRELPAFSTQARGTELIDHIEARDLRTAVVTWRQTYIDADQMFTGQSRPIPRHLLDDAYSTNKAGFSELRYWQEDFIGLGPFRLKEWVRGSHLVLGAFDQYVLGRPKLDEIEVRFIIDSNAMIANLLAGSLDMTFAQAIGLDQALAVRERWPTGQVQLELNGWTVVYPQFVDTNPSIITNVQFRRALFHAINREQLAQELMGGLVGRADNVFSLGTAEYEATQASTVLYEHDPRRASQMIEALGYTRGADTQFRDAGGQPLELEVRAYLQREIAVKAALAVVDSWKAIGVGAESSVRPAQAASNRQEQATFPGFLVVRQGNGLSSAVRLHSREARLPASNYTGDNNGRYLNPEIDTLIDRYQTTIRWTERMQLAGQIVRHMGDQLPLMPLFYDASPVLMGNHVLIQDPHNAWNAHEWNVRSEGGRGQ